MGDNARSIVSLIAILVVALLVAGLGFAFYRNAKSTADSAQNELSNFNTTLTESKYTDYEGRTILGNEVLSFLNANANTEIAIQVITASGSNKIYNYASIDMAGDPTYINPNGKFECTLNRDANSTITGIIFTQQ